MSSTMLTAFPPSDVVGTLPTNYSQQHVMASKTCYVERRSPDCRPLDTSKVPLRSFHGFSALADINTTWFTPFSARCTIQKTTPFSAPPLSSPQIVHFLHHYVLPTARTSIVHEQQSLPQCQLPAHTPPSLSPNNSARRNLIFWPGMGLNLGNVSSYNTFTLTVL